VFSRPLGKFTRGAARRALSLAPAGKGKAAIAPDKFGLIALHGGRLLAVLLLTAATASCGSNVSSPSASGEVAIAPTPTPTASPAPTPTPSPAPTASPTVPSAPSPTRRPTPTPLPTLTPLPLLTVDSACGSTTYRRCASSFELIVSMASGELVAVCEYNGGIGDIVLIDAPDQSSDVCSASRLIKPSRVVVVGRLPYAFVALAAQIATVRKHVDRASAIPASRLPVPRLETAAAPRRAL